MELVPFSPVPVISERDQLLWSADNFDVDDACAKGFIAGKIPAYTYQYEDWNLFDYNLFTFDGMGGYFRGPAPQALEKGCYAVALGSANTFGRFAQDPWPALLGRALQIPMLNLGQAGAGPWLYSKPQNRDFVSHICNSAKFVFIEVMSGRSASNSEYVNDSGCAGGVHRVTGERELNLHLPFQEALQTQDLTRLRRLVESSLESYEQSFSELLSMISAKVVLVYHSMRDSHVFSLDDSTTLRSGVFNFPHLINDVILERLLSQSEILVKVIRPLNPDLAINRFSGKKTYFSNTNKRRQNYYLGQLGHRRVAAEVIKQMSLFQLG